MTIRWASLLFALAALCGFARPSHADWPHLRGPNYDGVSSEVGLADSWPDGGPRQLWSRDLGQGHSGIIIGDGKLFTQSQRAAGQFLVCLDPASGDMIWGTRYARPWQLHGAYPGPYATPTFHLGKIYFTSPTGLVGCADAASGTTLWSIDVQERFAGRGYGFGFAATPLVEDGRVILPVGGAEASIVALDVADGKTLWAVGSDPASYCPALPISLGGRRYVVGNMQNALLLVDPARGKIVHRQQLSKGYDEHSAWPLYREPHLLLTAPFRAAAASSRIEIKPDETLTLQPIWSGKNLSNDVASSVLYRDSVYGFDLKQLQSSVHRPSRGTFRCLDWATGDVRWSTDRVGHATVLAADGKLFLLTDTGELVLAGAGVAKYQELARTSPFTDEVCWTPPTLWQGRLFVRSPSRLLCLDVAKERAAVIHSPNLAKPPRGSAWRIESSWLMSREREFPNDAPSGHEAREWFGACLLILGIGALGTIILRLTFDRPIGRQLPSMPAFLTLTFTLGALGPNVFSSIMHRCFFTWPVSVFAALHAATFICITADDSRAGRWTARLGIFGLVAICLLYFLACRTAGLFVGWYYLIGLPPGVLVSAAAIRMRHRPAWSALLTLLASAAFYWSTQSYFVWNAGRGE